MISRLLSNVRLLLLLVALLLPVLLLVACPVGTTVLYSNSQTGAQITTQLLSLSRLQCTCRVCPARAGLGVCRSCRSLQLGDMLEGCPASLLKLQGSFLPATAQSQSPCLAHHCKLVRLTLDLLLASALSHWLCCNGAVILARHIPARFTHAPVVI